MVYTSIPGVERRNFTQVHVARPLIAARCSYLNSWSGCSRCTCTCKCSTVTALLHIHVHVHENFASGCIHVHVHVHVNMGSGDLTSPGPTEQILRNGTCVVKYASTCTCALYMCVVSDMGWTLRQTATQYVPHSSGPYGR